MSKYGVGDAAIVLGVSTDTVRRWVDAGRIKATRTPGGRRQIDGVALARFAQSLHAAADAGTPVVLNPAAFTHYSYALRDACAQLTAPLVEVHISNVHKRETFRHHSYLSDVAEGVIVGLGTIGYRLALQAAAARPHPGDGKP